MCFTAQSGHEQGDRGLLSCCLLHIKWHFASRTSFPCNIQLLIFTVVTQLALLSIPITFPDPLPRSSGDQSSFWTYYLPLPDQTARLSSDLFNFSECGLCKTNILEHGYGDHSLISKCPTPNKTQKTLYFHFYTDAFLFTKFLV